MKIMNDTWLVGLSEEVQAGLACIATLKVGRVYTWKPTGSRSSPLRDESQLRRWVVNVVGAATGPSAESAAAPAPAAITNDVTLHISMHGYVPVVHGGELYRALFRGNGAYDWLKRNVASCGLVERVDYITEGCVHSHSKPFTTLLTLSAARIMLASARLHVIAARLKARALCAWLDVDMQKRGDVKFNRTNGVAPVVEGTLVRETPAESVWTPTVDVTCGGVPVLSIIPGVSAGNTKGIERVQFGLDLLDTDSTRRQDEPDNSPTTAVRDAYDAGACPDCHEDIPANAPEGASCANCDHALFSAEPPAADCLDVVVVSNDETPTDIFGMLLTSDDPGNRFPVNARGLHEYLEIGRDFSTWIKERISQFQLVEAVDYGIFPGLGENSGRGRPTKDYRLHPTAARLLSADIHTERGRRVIKFLVDVAEKAMLPAPVVPALPRDFSEALRQLADTVDANEQLMLENAKVTEELALETTVRQSAEKKVEEAQEEIDELIASLDRPHEAVPVWDFFKLTRGTLGMSRPVGFAMCRQMGILCEAEENQWGIDETLPHSDWEGKGYFAIRHENVRVPEVENGKKTSNYMMAKSRVTKLTPDRRDKDGNVVKTGGFTWLLNKLYKDERCLLYRLVQKAGGSDGQFRPLYGCIPVWCQDSELPANVKLSHKIIRVYKPRKSRKETHWRVARQIKEAQYLAEGLTLAEALTNLNAMIPKDAPRVFGKKEEDE